METMQFQVLLSIAIVWKILKFLREFYRLCKSILRLFLDTILQKSRDYLFCVWNWHLNGISTLPNKPLKIFIRISIEKSDYRNYQDPERREQGKPQDHNSVLNKNSLVPSGTVQESYSLLSYGNKRRWFQES